MLNLEGDAVLWSLGGSTRPGPPACTLLGAGPGVPPHESPVPALSTGPLKLPGEGAAVVRPGVGTPPGSDSRTRVWLYPDWLRNLTLPAAAVPSSVKRGCSSR